MKEKITVESSFARLSTKVSGQIAAKGYVLFAGHRYYPRGLEDFRAFGTIDELKKLFDEKIDDWSTEVSYPGTHWGEIGEAKTMKIVLRKIDDKDWKET